MGNLLKTLGRKAVSGFLVLLPFLLAYLLIGGFYALMEITAKLIGDSGFSSPSMPTPMPCWSTRTSPTWTRDVSSPSSAFCF